MGLIGSRRTGPRTLSVPIGEKCNRHAAAPFFAAPIRPGIRNRVSGIFTGVFGKAVNDNLLAFVRVIAMPWARKLSGDKSHQAGDLSVFVALIKDDLDRTTTASCLAGEFKVTRKCVVIMKGKIRDLRGQ
jgi:hypothetical protein